MYTRKRLERIYFWEKGTIFLPLCKVQIAPTSAFLASWGGTHCFSPWYCSSKLRTAAGIVVYIEFLRDRLPTPLFLGFPNSSDGKESACSAGDLGSVPGLGRSPGEGTGYPPQCSCLENSMDRGAWRAIVYKVTNSQTQLSHFHFQGLNTHAC